MASLRDVVTDCAQPARLARFWAQVLDGYEIAPYDDAERARLATLGITDLEDDPTVLVQPVGGGSDVRFWFQKVPEAKVVKNRVHVDLTAKDVGAEVERLLALGAAVVLEGPDTIVLADPEGNEFCLTR
ncbi:VOC family protein [Pseudactinotalea terrae]|uniref:VOC family protein n=1 Tax=Pseudactinotalea terrae TaxID=1743262 RepID=UPI0012E318A2|nr:VOC family protein [Pseudactinotalea terrae]